MICEELESCYLGSCELDQCTRVHLFNSCVHVLQTYCWSYAALFVPTVRHCRWWTSDAKLYCWSWQPRSLFMFWITGYCRTLNFGHP